MSDSIKISPKHGLNATIPICFWCGNEKNEIALLGKIDRKDSEAPRRVVLDYEPCDKCKEIFSHGIHCIGVVEQPPVAGMFPISEHDGKSLYPTGTMLLAPESFIEALLSQPDEQELKKRVLESRKLIMPEEVCVYYVEEAKKNGASDMIEDEVKEEDTNEDS